MKKHALYSERQNNTEESAERNEGQGITQKHWHGTNELRGRKKEAGPENSTLFLRKKEKYATDRQVKTVHDTRRENERNILQESDL